MCLDSSLMKYYLYQTKRGVVARMKIRQNGKEQLRKKEGFFLKGFRQVECLSMLSKINFYLGLNFFFC